MKWSQRGDGKRCPAWAAAQSGRARWRTGGAVPPFSVRNLRTKGCRTASYKGRPLVRCKNELYYGSLEDPFVVFLQILTTKKENDEEIADRVHLTLLSTDTTLTPKNRIIKQSDKNGLYNALDFATIMLERQLADAKKNAPKK